MNVRLGEVRKSARSPYINNNISDLLDDAKETENNDGCLAQRKDDASYNVAGPSVKDEEFQILQTSHPPVGGFLDHVPTLLGGEKRNKMAS
jgi:hypothetical protein